RSSPAISSSPSYSGQASRTEPGGPGRTCPVSGRSRESTSWRSAPFAMRSANCALKGSCAAWPSGARWSWTAPRTEQRDSRKRRRPWSGIMVNVTNDEPGEQEAAGTEPDEQQPAEGEPGEQHTGTGVAGRKTTGGNFTPLAGILARQQQLADLISR